jgi:hypothetical protein
VSIITSGMLDESTMADLREPILNKKIIEMNEINILIEIQFVQNNVLENNTTSFVSIISNTLYKSRFLYMVLKLYRRFFIP